MDNFPLFVSLSLLYFAAASSPKPRAASTGLISPALSFCMSIRPSQHNRQTY